MTTKQDYAFGALVGFLAGVFAVPTVVALGLRSQPVLIALPLAGAAGIVIGVWLGNILSRFVPIFSQLARFAAVGFLNTAIDFGVLNILSAVTGVTAGFVVGGVNVPGFILAVVNAYFWNKYWVFKDRAGGVLEDFPKFLAVSFIGILLNSGIVVLVTTSISPQFGLPDKTWLNLAKAAATAASLVWNFLGYKFFVFGRRQEVPLVNLQG